MNEYKEKFFLAANSSEGFVSYFSESYDYFDGWRVYIIKGGPGTGKSSFMRKVALDASIYGIKSIFCPCSSDPDSLDAVIFEEIKTIILDGTAPHIVEPVLPGACENIINLGECWDKESLYKNRKEIIEATLKNKMLHKSASLYLRAAGSFLKNNIKLCEPYINKPLLEEFAAKNLKKIPQKSTQGKEKIRFLSGVTPKGIIDFSYMANAYKKRIIIRDDYTVCAPYILKIIGEQLLLNGYDIITLKNPFLPSITDHIFVPELSLCYLTESSYIKFTVDDRRIHARRFLDVGSVNRLREKRRFNKKAFDEIIDSAVVWLKEAKENHDTLESYYIGAMNFDKVKDLAKKTAEEIINIASLR